MGKLGKGCSIEDHVLYGMCRDRNCFQRALFEKTAMAANDRLRLRGYQPKTFFANELLRAERERLKGKYQYPKDLDGQAAGVEGEEVEEDEEDLSLRLRKESASDRYLVSAWPMLPEPIYAMTALYAAAVFNDLPTIKKLGEMGINPNVAQPDTGYTPLHIAAIKRYHQAVYYLLHYFHNPQSSAGAGNQHHWLNINARDLHGNTALHYASRQGCEEVVAMLCQEEDIDPEVTNDFGQRPLDIIGNHQVFSYLKLAMERNALKRELASIQKLPVASAAATTTAALRTSRRSQRSTQKQ